MRPIVCGLVVIAFSISSGAALADDDIIWQNKSGQVHYWLIKKGERLDGKNIGASGPVGTDWTLSGAGDVNDDGTDDILWLHRNGQAHYWPIKNGRRLDGLNFGEPSDMVLVGAGDMDGDGTDDLVWAGDSYTRIKFWPIREAKRSGEREITNLALGNRVVAIGDMNGDRTDDLVVGRVVAGKWQLTAFLIQKGQVFKNVQVLANDAPDASWSIRGAGDLDGDGFDELVWKKLNGQVRYWVVRDGVVKSEADIGGPIADAEWRLVGVGNVDDGFSPQPGTLDDVSQRP